MNGKCDWCYTEQIDADLAITMRNRPIGIEMEICRNCVLLIRNVFSIAMHRISHVQIVDAVVNKMEELELEYKDLMISIWDTPKAIES